MISYGLEASLASPIILSAWYYGENGGFQIVIENPDYWKYIYHQRWVLEAWLPPEKLKEWEKQAFRTPLGVFDPSDKNW